MPYATAHILIMLILAKFIRERSAKKETFPKNYILICAIAAVLPDIDIALYYILYFFGFSLNEIHRTFTHTIFIPLILFLIGMLFYYNKNKKAGITFSLLSAGCLLHLILDLLILRKLSLFYPISTLPLGLGLMKYLPREMQEIILPTIDAICIFIWVILFETKPKKANKNLYKGIPPKHN